MVAAWDTERGQPPAFLGQFSGTPSIKAFLPEGKKNKKKELAYNGAREVKDMEKWVTGMMPSFVEKVQGDSAFTKFKEKAATYGLPVILLFSKSTSTKPLIKALSTEYRRRVLFAEIRNVAKNKAIIDEYKVQKFPTLMAFKKEGGKRVIFEKKPTFNRLNNFVSDFALKKPVKGKKKKPEPKEEL
jgi:thiol-disulfide isomerase/thioredoxin